MALNDRGGDRTTPAADLELRYAVIAARNAVDQAAQAVAHARTCARDAITHGNLAAIDDYNALAATAAGLAGHAMNWGEDDR